MSDPDKPESQPVDSDRSSEVGERTERRPRRRRAPKPDASMSVEGQPLGETVAAAQPTAEAAGLPSAEGGASLDPQSAGTAQSGRETDPLRRKRSRNRRRNRRDGKRMDDGGVEGRSQPPEGADEISPVPLNLPVTDVNELFEQVVSGAYDEAADAAPDTSLAPGAVSAPDAVESPVDIPLDLQEIAPSEVDPPEPPTATAGPGRNEEIQPTDGHAAEDGDAGDPPDVSPATSQQRPQPGRRVLAPEADAPKLQKVLAQAGVGSRRDLEQMIVDGRVAVNGQAAHVGQRIRVGDRITLDGKPVRVRITPPVARVLAYHKPVGEVVTYDDPQARPTVFRRLPRLPHGKWQSVGRLDINTEGLLLFTNSGDLANRLMHPRFGVEREYAVRVLGTLNDEERERLLEGVVIDGQPAAFRSITDGGGEGANHWYRVVITEGRNREVRKLFDSVDKAVSRLIRIRYGSVVLPRGLRRGVWVDLGVDDLKALREATGMPARPADDAKRGGRPGDAPRNGGDEERRGKGRNARGRGRRRDEGPQDRPNTRRNTAIPDFDDAEDLDNIGPIPDPLQQTYDKRAFQQSNRRTREYGEDGPIPNPLQQTYDKRAIQGDRKPQRDYSEDGPIPNPLQQTYDKRFASSGPGSGKAGGGRSRHAGAKPARKSTSGGQPDPMKTAVGYIGGDAFLNKSRGGGRGGRGGGSKPGGGGGRGRSGSGR